MSLREAAQQALEALEFMADEWGFTQKANRPERWQAIDALKAALEQPNRAQAMRDAGYTRRPTLREMAEPEQEPVAWMRKRDNRLAVNDGGIFDCDWTPLYAHPPRREWRGLKEWEINDGLDQLPTEDVCSWSFRKGVYFAEAALKERNA
jgi:hypothetical protein